MKISIVIVNYNVEYFLEQCLISVFKSLKGIEGEVFVVDNNSVDNSLLMLKQKFPQVKLIENKENLGFSKANNQAIKQCVGEYVLLLNPDTVVEEMTFRKVIDFMDATPDAGAVGVKMLDGKGNFLPESKRSLPTPEVSFYKIFGLSKLFPKSKKFGKYHLSYLDKNKIHEVDVLSGAFMFIRREVLEKIGLLDETFFMYGEDIDLSYRILKAGYKNYYFPETRIIHYKGESTKKSSANYVFVFYNAMIIFAKKHYSSGKQKAFIGIIKFAIWFRAALALLVRFFKKIYVPVLDFLVLGLGLIYIGNLWQSHVSGEIPPMLFKLGITAYILVWMSSVFLNGGYDKPTNLWKIIKGVLIGSGIILIAYSLLPESYRFSRAIILLGTLWTIIWFLASRFIFHKIKLDGMIFKGSQRKRALIIGDDEEIKRVNLILKKSNTELGYTHFLLFENDDKKNAEHYYLSKISEIVNIHKINEIIFCAKNITSYEIINIMSQINSKHIEFKIAPPESLFVIGSKDISHAESYYMYDVNNIGKYENVRRKRVFDFFMSFLFLLLSPILIFIMKSPLGFLRNNFHVLFGCKTFVGYGHMSNTEYMLPKIKKGILTPADITRKAIDNDETIANFNVMYARDYSVWRDFQIIFYNIRNLGKK
ncbi:MAG: glycosyltransferase [Bacteroidales bacterium]|nr:glycosyltransferase [Bacteroidales bacterium]